MLVATKVCLSRQGKTRLLSRQNYACRDKYLSLQRFCRGKHTFVATKDVLCCDKRVFVATKTYLSRQKLYLWQLPPVILHNVAKGQPASRQMSLAAALLITTAQDIFAAQGSSQNKNLTRSCPLWAAGLIC